ncbi:MAG: NAD(P)/FAD-dependent oxidoreductase [Bryobacteraceae bacterium]|nr:NAD(P)/FAD-dependent oxidoreductase [Bryobacteraceae bacterium]
MKNEFDAIVVGGGAAGLFCTAMATQRGRRVLLIEHGEALGRKILISGGGRCNFTNSGTQAGNFLSANPHFAKSALARYTPADFLALVERHGIAWHEKKLGQLFCDGSARQIVDLLQAECAGATILTNTRVERVERGFAVRTSAGDFRAPKLVIATGGLSIPKLGATDWGYRLAQQFGLKLVTARPALVPLTFLPADAQAFEGLAGVAADVEATAGGARFAERLLVTHRGLSGPAILQASSYWQPGETLRLDLAPGQDLEAEFLRRKRSGERTQVKAVLTAFLPLRLADRWAQLHSLDRPLAHARDTDLRAAAQQLQHWHWRPAGTEGYAKAEVTAGGVATDELSSKTMESRRAPGLHWIGEVVDVTGHLGGYNFQWAWASAFAAAEAL